MSIGLKARVGAIRARLKSRPDSEHEQAIVRLALVTVIVGYLTITDWTGHESTRDSCSTCCSACTSQSQSVS